MERLVITKLSNGFSISKFRGESEVASGAVEAAFTFEGSTVPNYDQAFLEAYLKLFVISAEYLGIDLEDEAGDEIVITARTNLKTTN